MQIDARSEPGINADLGRAVSTHPTAAVFVQRAAIVALISFVFFLLMLIGFSIRQHFGYFLLASAFLVVYLFTMFGWWVQKRSVLTIYENGLSYKKFRNSWSDIAAAEESADAKGSITIKLTDNKRRSVSIPPTLDRYDRVVQQVRANVRIDNS
ncbi:MAG: hypothetical protein ABI791_01290 [Acidobacteriota bacterium]